jgi:hypothetical protein
MGVMIEAFDDVNNFIDKNLNNIQNILILGDQVFNLTHFPNHRPSTRYVDILKKKYQNINFDVIDIQGDSNLKFNLNNIIETNKNKYDLILDYGTVEHVDNQYNCFLNIDNFLKNGGHYYSICVDFEKAKEKNEWMDHCFYYYDLDFFKFLEKTLDWKIIKYYHSNNPLSSSSLIFVFLQKNNLNPEKENLKNIYKNINIVLRETYITQLNMSNLDNVKNNKAENPDMWSY